MNKYYALEQGNGIGDKREGWGGGRERAGEVVKGDSERGGEKEALGWIFSGSLTPFSLFFGPFFVCV
jgi:hypothetical protein